MKKIIYILSIVFILAGCAVQERTEKTELTAVTTIPVTEALEPTTPSLGETASPTEPNLPWDPNVRWYRTYYFDKRPNPDSNIVEGMVRFNALLRNEGREALTVVSAHADFYLGTELVAQEDFDADRLLDFLPHPRVGDLVLEYGESVVFQLYSTVQEQGSYDRVVVTYTITDANSSESTQPFHFTVNEEDITPYSFSDRTDWSPASRTEQQWNFHTFPHNTTDKTLEYVGDYVVIFQDGLPMGSDFVDKSRVSPQALKDIRVLDPGEMMHYQSSITHRFNTTNEREHTMIYRDEVGELYLQTFRFALDEAMAYPEPLPILPYIYELSGITVLDTPEKREQELGTSQYTREEIRQMIDSGLTLDEWAEKLSNLYEVQLLIQEAGIEFRGGDIKARIDGILWHFNDSPEVVFRQRHGTCGSGSSFINYLLRDDYDEQGYLQQANNAGGHIINYFRSGNKYYIYDWTKIEVGSFDVMIADSLETFGEAYIRAGHAIEGRQPILQLYSYPYDGNHRPQGDGVRTYTGHPSLTVVPAEIENIISVLFVENEQFTPVFIECPPVDQWPADAQ